MQDDQIYGQAVAWTEWPESSQICEVVEILGFVVVVDFRKKGAKEMWQRSLLLRYYNHFAYYSKVIISYLENKMRFHFSQVKNKKWVARFFT